MTTVYVVTAGSGEATASNGSTSTPTRPTGSPRTTTALPRWSRFRWRNGRPVARPSAYDGPYWRAQWWARVPVGKRRGALRHTDEGERFEDFAIRQEWWTGEALPEATVVRRELTGAPKIEVVGLSKEKVEEIFWDAVTQVRADLAGVRGNNLRLSCGRWKETGIATRHCRPCPS